MLFGVTKMTDKIADDLFAAGCDDATLSIRHGAAYLDFTRTALTVKDALLSAICDVRKAGLDVLRGNAVELITQADKTRLPLTPEVVALRRIVLEVVTEDVVRRALQKRCQIAEGGHIPAMLCCSPRGVGKVDWVAAHQQE